MDMYDQSDLPAPNGRMGLRWNVSSWRPADGGRAEADCRHCAEANQPRPKHLDEQLADASMAKVENKSQGGYIIAYANNIKKCVVNWLTSAAGDLTVLSARWVQATSRGAADDG